MRTLTDIFRTIRQQRRLIRFLISRLIPALRLHYLFRIHRAGYRLYFHRSALSKRLWASKMENPQGANMMASLLTPGETCVDVGANIGDYTLAAACAVGPSGHVYAFEAHPRTMCFLRENLKLTNVRHVSTGQLVVGARTGWANFTDHKSDNVNRITDDPETIRVPMVRLEPFIREPHIVLLKIDVEGAEHDVLKGLGTRLSDIKIVLFEVQDDHFDTFGTSFADIHDLLTDSGFLVFEFSGEALREVERSERFLTYRNLLACRDRATLETRLETRLTSVKP